MKRLAAIFLSVLALSQVACSKQWRENNVALSGEDVRAQLDQVSAMDVGGGYEDFVDFANTPGTSIYFADSDIMGPPPVVASILDFSFMLDPFTLADVLSVKVFFLDDASHNNALMIVANLIDNSTSTDIFWGQGVVNGGQFSADLVSDDGAAGLTVKSYDINKGGELNGTIQLKTYLPSNTYIGKFSTLVGYK